MCFNCNLHEPLEGAVKREGRIEIQPWINLTAKLEKEFIDAVTYRSLMSNKRNSIFLIASASRLFSIVPVPVW